MAIEHMPNIAQALKAEIARIAKKELRSETQSMKKAQAALRSDVAALKRHARQLEQAIRTLGRYAQKAQKTTADPASPNEAIKTRFSAKSLSSQRRRLGLSAEDCGKLIGASGQSVYNWEAGKARPRDSHLPAISALKTLGRRAAAAHLAAMGSVR